MDNGPDLPFPPELDKLTAIRGWAQLIQADPQTSERSFGYAEKIVEIADDMLQLAWKRWHDLRRG